MLKSLVSICREEYTECALDHSQIQELCRQFTIMTVSDLEGQKENA